MFVLENMRQKEMLVHEIWLKELENERRREERQHELMLVNLLSQNRNPFQRPISSSICETMYSNVVLETRKLSYHSLSVNAVSTI